MRSNTTQRNIWAQLSVSACALLLPPMALGAAVYSMLPARDEGGTHEADKVAVPSVVAPKLQVGALRPWPVGADARSARQADQLTPAAGKSAWAARTAVSETNARQASSKSVKDTARLSDSVPRQATAMPLAGTGLPQPGEADGAPTGSIGGVEPLGSVPAEVSMTLLPRMLAPSAQVPAQISRPRMSATEMPAAQTPPPPDPSAEGPPAPAHKHLRPSYLANLARRSGIRAEARNEVQVHRPARPQPQPQQTFSLREWLHQLGTRPRNPRG